MPANPYAMNPITLTRAKVTTLRWARTAPRPDPNRVPIHSAPVMTFERRIHFDM